MGLKRPIFLSGMALLFAASVLCAAAEDTAELDKADEILFRRVKAETRRDDGSVYQLLGLSYFKQQNFDRSMMYFSRAVAANPRLYWSWYYMGILNLGKPEGYFQKAIAANPRFAPPYYWLARYYCKRGDAKRSIKFFEDYIRIGRNDVQEAERVVIAKKFLELLKSGETDYEAIIKKVPGV